MNQSEINKFKRTYFDLRRNPKLCCINHDPNTTWEHREVVNRICEWLTRRKTPFYTRVYTKGGEIVDIVALGTVKPFIEVRHSEKEKTKEYCSEYDGLRQFVDTDDPFRLL